LHAGGYNDDDDDDDYDDATFVGLWRGGGATAGAGGTAGSAAAAPATLPHLDPAAGVSGLDVVHAADSVARLLVEPVVYYHVDRHDDHDQCATGQYPAGTDPDAEPGTSGGKMSYDASPQTLPRIILLVPILPISSR